MRILEANDVSKKYMRKQVLNGLNILLQTLLLFISNAFFWNSHMTEVFTGKSNTAQGIGVLSGVSMVAFFLMAVLVGLFPFIESLIDLIRICQENNLCWSI